MLASDVVARFLDTALYIKKRNEVTVISEAGKVTTAALDNGCRPERVNFKQVRLFTVQFIIKRIQ